MSTRASLLLGCAFLAWVAAPAATTLTVHNQTNLTLAVTRHWSPWRPEPDDGPMTFPFFQRWIRPGARATYTFQIPGKELDSEMVIRQLPPDGIVDFESMTIRAITPDSGPMGEEPPPEPTAPEIRSSL